ncbi:MAG: flagellar motor switch protein FliM, partial [Thermovirga sp.]|nr:flagellar motor switch protein FliM [Thermovirga sp.]
LNQSEIDKLLSALASGESNVVVEEPSKAVRTYDFRRPSKFNRDQIRAFQMLHEAFGRYMTGSLSAMTRSVVSVDVTNVEQVPYEEFVCSVASPTTIAILEVVPLGGKAILEISQKLVFALIERLLGGKGLPPANVREFTDLESAIVDRILYKVLKEFEESWKTLDKDIRFKLVNKESNPFFVQIAPKTEMMLLVTIRVQVGSTEGNMNLGLPYHTLEPILDKFNPQEWFLSKYKSLSEEERKKLKEKVESVEVEISAELCSATLALKDVCDISLGDVVNLGVPISQPGLLRVGPIPKFHVAFGRTEKGHIAAKVLDVLHQEEEETL